MAKLIVQHRVQDYARWKPVFDDRKLREKHGAKGHTLYRAVDDPRVMVILTEFPTTQGAKAFAADPALKEQMARAGVESVPNIYLCEEVETVRY